MNSLIPRDITLSKLSDKELIESINSSTALLRSKILNEIAIRRKKSAELKDALFKAITDLNNRQEIFFGFIKVAWIPVISVLEEADENEKRELIDFLKREWDLNERKALYEYIKNDFDIKNIISE